MTATAPIKKTPIQIAATTINNTAYLFALTEDGDIFMQSGVSVPSSTGWQRFPPIMLATTTDNPTGAYIVPTDDAAVDLPDTSDIKYTTLPQVS